MGADPNVDATLGTLHLMASDPEVAKREMDGLLRGGRLTTFDPSWFEYGGRTLTPNQVVSLLRPHLTHQRIEAIESTLANRTYNLAVVVDGMVDTGNVAAVMRSADAFGVQAFYAVDRSSSYKHSKRTAQGVRKWLDRWVYRSGEEAAAALRDRGYRIVVADLTEDAVPVDQVDFSTRTALVFGNELAGVSEEFRRSADVVAMIPMSGFVQSLNISVAAAICLHEARRDRTARLGAHGDLTDADIDRLRAVFAIKSVKKARQIIDRYLSSGATKFSGFVEPSDSVT